ncbi:MAG TPA: hypothetical protein VMU26_25390 [Candidatus Polarisedimenticolia bacterium]|nr:hypothetical protein [Candidatus Polarisedimenticolia bacterium]
MNRILPNVIDVQQVVFRIANATIRKTLLPDLGIRAKFLFGAVREPTLDEDELDSLFQIRLWDKENVNVIGHNYKLMQQTCGAAIMAKGVDEPLGLTAFPQRLKRRSSFSASYRAS